MTAELYTGMEIPDFTYRDQKGKTIHFHDTLKGTAALLGIYGKQEPDSIADIRKQIESLEQKNIAFYVLSDQRLRNGNHAIFDPEMDIQKQLSPDCQWFSFLIDEKGKILYAQYADSPEKLTGLSEYVRNWNGPAVTKELLEEILDAYPYEIVFADRNHVVQYMNRTARKRYGDRVKTGNSLFNCHNEKSREKIMKFLERADAGEGEMFETYNRKTGEREFFVPVRNHSGMVIGYFERHEASWDKENASEPIGNYWKHRTD